jgi:hypothetical protein
LLDLGADGKPEHVRLCGFSHAVIVASGGRTEATEQSEAGTLW